MKNVKYWTKKEKYKKRRQADGKKRQPQKKDTHTKKDRPIKDRTVQRDHRGIIFVSLYTTIKIVC